MKNRQRSNSWISAMLDSSELNSLLSLEEEPTQPLYCPACLSPQIYNSFKSANNIQDLMQWQKDCLSLLHSNPNNPFQNFAIRAPTGAGKSLLSDIFGIQSVLVAKPNSKAIYIMPYISLMFERADKLKSSCDCLGLRLVQLTTGKPLSSFDEADILICTIEKANMLIYWAIQENKLTSISAIIVDEIQFLADPTRGSLLEILLTKLIYLQLEKKLELQIFAISATISNIEDLAKWMNAEKLVCEEKPISVQEYVKAGSKLYSSEGNLKEIIKEKEHDTLRIMSIVENSKTNGSILIFSSTKSMCKFLASHISKNTTGEDLKIQEQRQEIVKEMNLMRFYRFTNQKEWLLKGIACHHAGMKIEERRMVENFFRKGLITILTCTSTLAVGVNLPAKTVLIFGLTIGLTRISSTMYRQICGRAGRLSKDQQGKCIILCKDAELAPALAILQNAVVGSAIISTLNNEQTGLKRVILEAICLGIAVTAQEILEYITYTLVYTQQLVSNNNDKGVVKEIIKNNSKEAIRFLKANELIIKAGKSYKATKLGIVICESGLHPEEMLAAYWDMQLANQNMILGSQLFSTYLITPLLLNINIKWDLLLKYFHNVLRGDNQTQKKVMEIIGIDEDYIVMCTQVPPGPFVK